MIDMTFPATENSQEIEMGSKPTRSTYVVENSGVIGTEN